MIRMGRDGAFRPHSDHHMGANLPNTSCQISNGGIKVLLVEFAVGIIEDSPAAHPQQLTGGGKFPPAYLGQFVIRLGPAAMRRRLPRGEAKHMGFNSSLAIVHQSSAKATSLIVRMCSNT